MEKSSPLQVVILSLSRANNFNFSEQLVLAGLFVMVVLQIACALDACGNVLQKDMAIASLLDVPRLVQPASSGHGSPHVK